MARGGYSSGVKRIALALVLTLAACSKQEEPVKPIAEIKGKPMRLLIQGVGARIQHQFDRAWRAGE